MFLALHVDDGLIVFDSYEVIEVIIGELRKSFDLSIGNRKSFVGMQIVRDRVNKKMLIHQENYTKKIIEKYGLQDVKSISILANLHVTLGPNDSNEVSNANISYREAVGSLMFLSIISRPNITYIYF